MRIGVLALQGDFAPHLRALERSGIPCIEVRTSHDLTEINGIILPGGESTAMLRLMNGELFVRLRQAIEGGLPTFATCAGAILLAKEVKNPVQNSLGVLDIVAVRNSYGRQLDSFISRDLTWSKEGEKWCADLGTHSPPQIEGVFIRAPRFESLGATVLPLIMHGDEPVLVKKGPIMAAAFHPELSIGASPLHELFIAGIPS